MWCSFNRRKCWAVDFANAEEHAAGGLCRVVERFQHIDGGGQQGLVTGRAASFLRENADDNRTTSVIDAASKRGLVGNAESNIDGTYSVVVLGGAAVMLSK